MKICIIGCGIINAMKGNWEGGSEKQLALILKSLKSDGADIVVLDYYLKKSEVISGINFYPAWSNNSESFLSKLNDLYNNLNKYRVNIIYVRGTHLYVAFLYLTLKLFRKKIKLFWGLAGDHDLTSRYNHLRVKHASSLYEKINESVIFNISSKLLLHFSDAIICQTSKQMKMCKSKYDKNNITLISNIYSIQKSNAYKLEKEIVADAIWIGKFTGTKGEDVLFKLAKDIPQMKIICLGHVTENFKRTKLYGMIKKQKNLIQIGRVPNKDVLRYISKVNFVLNTSPAEGLSNVFLEGWDLEKPVISFNVNPNEYLTKGKAGYCAENSYSKLVEKLRNVLKNKKYMKYHGKRGKEILQQEHSPQVILPKYKKLFYNSL